MEVFDGWVVTGTGAAVACAAIILCAAAGMAMTTPLGSVACTCAAIATPSCAAMPTGAAGICTANCPPGATSSGTCTCTICPAGPATCSASPEPGFGRRRVTCAAGLLWGGIPDPKVWPGGVTCPPSLAWGGNLPPKIGWAGNPRRRTLFGGITCEKLLRAAATEAHVRQGSAPTHRATRRCSLSAGRHPCSSSGPQSQSPTRSPDVRCESCSQAQRHLHRSIWSSHGSESRTKRSGPRWRHVAPMLNHRARVTVANC